MNFNLFKLSVFSFRQFLLLLWFGVVCLGGINRSFGQVIPVKGIPFLRNFDYRAIKVEPTLSSPVMWDMLQDPAGNFYYANNEGIIIFDGKNWRKIPISKQVRSLSYDPATKRIYVACRGDIGYLKQTPQGGVEFSSVKSRIPREHTFLNDMDKVFSVNDGIYFVSSFRMFHIPRGKEASLNVAKTDSVDGTGVINGQLYVNFSSKGLKRIVNGVIQDIAGGEAFKGKSLKVIVPYDNNRALIGQSDGSLFWYTPAGGTFIPFVNEGTPIFTQNEVWAGRVLHSGNVAIATYNGGIIILNKDGKLLQTVNQSNGFPSNNIFSMYVGLEGSLWVGHDSGLSQMFPDLPVSSFETYSGLQGKIKALQEYDNQLVVGTATGIFVLQEGYYRKLPGLDFECWDLLEIQSRLMVASSDGIYDISEGYGNQILSDQVCIKLERSKTKINLMYIATSNGLFQAVFENGTWSVLGKIPGINEEIITVYEVNENELWLGTSFEGLIRVKNPSSPKPIIERFNASNGLTDGKVVVTDFMGRVIFMTTKGIYLFNNGTFERDGILSDAIGDVNTRIEPAPAPNASYWKYTEKGTFILSGQSKINVDPANFANLSSELPTLIYSGKSDVYVAYSNSLIRINDLTPLKWTKPFRTTIRQITLNDDSTYFEGYFPDGNEGVGFGQTSDFTPTFKFGYNTVTFWLGSSSYLNTQGNEFQYKLEGRDEDWSPWTKDPKIIFANLSEGNYKLVVRSKNALGIVSPEEKFEFGISPPWYRSWWAYILYVVGLVLTGFGTVRYFTNRIKEDNRRLEAAVQERTREVELQKDELQAKNVQIGEAFEELKSTKEQIEAQQEKILAASEQLMEKNHDLEQAFEELKSSKEQIEQQQAQIVQSEKLAALGQLIAGVAHEINTPLGAINGASKDLSDSLPEMLKKMPHFYKSMPGNLEPLFFRLVERTLEKAPVLSSREERQIKKDITTTLEELGANDPGSIARELVRIGVYKDIEEFKPLFTVDNSAELIDMASNIGWTRVNLSNITLAVQKTQKIVFALKSYARQSAAEEKIDTNVVENLEVVLTIYHNQLKKDVQVNTHFESNLPLIKAYPDELNQVWTNILHNAIQAMNNKGLITIDALKEGDEVVVRISDTGPGIPAHVLPRIFDAFYTTKAQGEGSGLGLNICKKIIDKHNGKIDVDTEPGRTTFVVRLPITVE